MLEDDRIKVVSTRDTMIRPFIKLLLGPFFGITPDITAPLERHQTKRRQIDELHVVHFLLIIFFVRHR